MQKWLCNLIFKQIGFLMSIDNYSYKKSKVIFGSILKNVNCLALLSLLARTNAELNGVKTILST